jgi:hypothetical protein
MWFLLVVYHCTSGLPRLVALIWRYHSLRNVMKHALLCPAGLRLSIRVILSMLYSHSDLIVEHRRDLSTRTVFPPPQKNDLVHSIWDIAWLSILRPLYEYGRYHFSKLLQSIQLARGPLSALTFNTWTLSHAGRVLNSSPTTV